MSSHNTTYTRHWNYAYNSRFKINDKHITTINELKGSVTVCSSNTDTFILNYRCTWLLLDTDSTCTDTDKHLAYTAFVLQTVWVALDAPAGKQTQACRT